jgi:hypothetical protein
MHYLFWLLLKYDWFHLFFAFHHSNVLYTAGELWTRHDSDVCHIYKAIDIIEKGGLAAVSESISYHIAPLCVFLLKLYTMAKFAGQS